MGQLKNSQELYVDYEKPLKLVKTIFLTWGFITVVNPFLLKELSYGVGFTDEQNNMLAYVFYATYFFFGIPGAFLINKFGFKKSLMYGLGVAASSVFLMVTGARSANFDLIFAAVVIQGAGFSILQVSANPYVILLGKSSGGAGRLSSAGAYNSFGTWLAPLIGSIIASSGIPDNMTLSNALEIQSFKTELVILPYVLITVIYVGLIVLVNFSDLPAIETIKDVDTNVKDDKNTSVLQYKHVVLGFFAIFFYVGAEVGVASKLYDFLDGHIEDDSLSNSINYIIPYYWGGAMVGRFVGANMLKDMNASKGLLLASLLAALFLTLAIVIPSQGAMFMILGIGLFNSIMWPCIFELGTHGMGRFTAWASSILVMGIIGGAAASFVIDHIVDSGNSINIALLVPLACYGFLIFYAAVGHKYKMKEEY